METPEYVRASLSDNFAYSSKTQDTTPISYRCDVFYACN